MKTQSWQLLTPMDALILDCDGTISQVEGIDVLAQSNQVYQPVRDLTDKAMNLTGLTAELYQQRLDLVRPRKDQIARLGDQYFAQISPHIEQVIKTFHLLGKPVFIVSAGIKQGIDLLAVKLDIPTDRVFAVSVSFDDKGNYTDFDHHSPMTQPAGKTVVVEQIKRCFPRVVHVGDGMNDFNAAHAAARFIGYGGAFYRENLAKACQFYINAKSTAAILPLSLTSQEINLLSHDHQQIVNLGINDIRENHVVINS